MKVRETGKTFAADVAETIAVVTEGRMSDPSVAFRGALQPLQVPQPKEDREECEFRRKLNIRRRKAKDAKRARRKNRR